jgi:hypothetical protein
MTNNKQQTAVDFVPYEIALELKQLGFDEPCIAHYTVVPEDNINWFTISEQAVTDNSSIFGSSKNYNTKWFETEGTISAPTYSQAFRWFRENYELDSEIYMNHEYGVKFYTYLVLKLKKSIVSHKSGYAVKQNTYGEAELACLKKLIEIVK